MINHNTISNFQVTVWELKYGKLTREHMSDLWKYNDSIHTFVSVRFSHRYIINVSPTQTYAIYHRYWWCCVADCMGTKLNLRTKELVHPVKQFTQFDLVRSIPTYAPKSLPLPLPYLQNFKTHTTQEHPHTCKCVPTHTHTQMQIFTALIVNTHAETGMLHKFPLRARDHWRDRDLRYARSPGNGFSLLEC